jgi:hypothetical protein
MATLKVEVDGSISEDGGGCAGTEWCASASGGSIYIASEDVLGTGYITANGGALAELSDDLVATAVVASGGGGRIAIYSNAQSAGLTIDVSGGAITDQLPAHAQGEKGTVYTDALSSTMTDASGSTGEESSTPATTFDSTAATTLPGSTVEITSTSATTSDIFAATTIYSPAKYPSAMLVNDSPTTPPSTLVTVPENPCNICPNGATVDNVYSFDGLTCMQIIEIALNLESDSLLCGLSARHIVHCCPPVLTPLEEEPEPNNVRVSVAAISAIAVTSFLAAVLAILAIY